MNKLAIEHKRMCEKGITSEEYEERKEKFLKHYFQLRDKEDKKIWNRLTLEQRKSIHWLILIIYKLKNRLGGFSYDVINDSRVETIRPIIYAVSHVGKFDIEVVSEAIDEHYYLLSGDFEHIQGIIDAPFLALNGVFYFNEIVKEDRQLVSLKMINHLKDGGNLLYFPEGTWNLSPNLLMLPCYWGIIDIARKGNALIVPVAAEQYGKHFKINIGANIDVNDYNDSFEGKSLAISELRDVLATLKWEIWEYMGVKKREEVNINEWDEYIKKRFEEWPYFNMDHIESLIFRPKNVILRENVYGPIKKLVPNKNNAFLYNKRNSDNIFDN